MLNLSISQTQNVWKSNIVSIFFGKRKINKVNVFRAKYHIYVELSVAFITNNDILIQKEKKRKIIKY